jgi:GTP-binding protein HflX
MSGAGANRRRPRRERAVLVGLHLPARPAWELEESIDELARLADSAGAEVVARVVQRRDRPDAATLLGRGKLEELVLLLKELDADLVLYDGELSPSQERNIAKVLEVRVVSRTDLILDIFAQRARTREGKLQVEMAQLTRRLTRLVGSSAALSRLGGGIGTRGPGETRLETDRRLVRDRLAHLRGQLEKIDRHRALYQRRRRKAPVAVVSLVGYTNAGKSTLLNAIAGSGVAAEDRLFSTLDPTSRRVALPGGRTCVFTDTVGFIRHIPPQLVAAFKGTLGELNEADLLLHVVDISHPAHEEQREVVLGFLRELGLEGKPRLEVYNKIDRLDPEDPLRTRGTGRAGAVAVSARSGERLPELLEQVRELLGAGDSFEAVLVVPYGRLGALAEARRRGELLEETALPEGLRVRLLLGPSAAARLGRLLGVRIAPAEKGFDRISGAK